MDRYRAELLEKMHEGVERVIQRNRSLTIEQRCAEYANCEFVE